MPDKQLKLIPFIITCCVLFYTLGEFTIYGDTPTIYHYLAFGAVVLNLVLYFTNFEAAILSTGLILLLAVFNLLAFFHDIVGTSLFFFINSDEGRIKIGTPQISTGMSIILLIYIILDGKLAVHSIRKLYTNYKL